MIIINNCVKDYDAMHHITLADLKFQFHLSHRT